MSIMNAILVTIGALAMILFFCAIVIFIERRFPSERYDERQKQARGNAYRLSFWTGMVYYLVVMTVLTFRIGKDIQIEPFLLIFGGLMVQVMVSHFYSILTNSALPLSEKPGIAVLAFLFCGILQLASHDYTHPIPFVGQGSQAWVTLLTGVSFLILALLHLISILRREKE